MARAITLIGLCRLYCPVQFQAWGAGQRTQLVSTVCQLHVGGSLLLTSSWVEVASPSLWNGQQLQVKGAEGPWLRYLQANREAALFPASSCESPGEGGGSGMQALLKGCGESHRSRCSAAPWQLCRPWEDMTRCTPEKVAQEGTSAVPPLSLCIQNRGLWAPGWQFNNPFYNFRRKPVGPGFNLDYRKMVNWAR